MNKLLVPEIKHVFRGSIESGLSTFHFSVTSISR